jgi:hypothetical protein
MHLTRCPECHGRVSPPRVVCPHCGAPIAGGGPVLMSLALLLLVIAGYAVIRA